MSIIIIAVNNKSNDSIIIYANKQTRFTINNELRLLLTHKLIVGNTLNSVIHTTRGQLVPFINIIMCA